MCLFSSETAVEIPSEDVPEVETQVGELEIKTEEETIMTESAPDVAVPAPEPSPVKKSPPKPERKPRVKPVAPAKPRKLLSLQYNYSDSEDEETREDRKARIVSFQFSRHLNPSPAEPGYTQPFRSQLIWICTVFNKYVNLYQQSGSSNLIGWKLEVRLAS